MTTFRTPNLDDFDRLMTSAAEAYVERVADAKMKVEDRFIAAGHGHGSNRLYLTVQKEITPLFRSALRQMAAIAIEFHQIHCFELAVVLERFREHSEKNHTSYARSDTTWKGL